MDANSIYTRRRFGIDINVLFVMLIVIVLCMGLLGYNLISKKTCTPFTISSYGFNNQKNNYFKVGETVAFTADLPPGSNLVWDCGDGMPTVQGINPKHVFLKEGRFVVTANGQGGCSQTLTINIQPIKIDEQHSEIVPLVPITGNIAPIAGTEVKYQCNLKASSYDWSITNSNNYEIKKGPAISYIFLIKGTYDLQVKLDNDPLKTYTLKIFVSAAPLPNMPKQEAIPKLLPTQQQSNNTHQPPSDEKPAEKKAVETPSVAEQKQPDAAPAVIKKSTTILIADNVFKMMLEDFISNEHNDKTITDFMPYLSYGIHTKVYENGKKQAVDFLTLCQHLQSSKKNEIKSLVLNREENKNVINIEISYKKKGWFPL